MAGGRVESSVMGDFSTTDMQIGRYRGRIRTATVQTAGLLWMDGIADHLAAADAVVLAQGRNRNVLVKMPAAHGGSLDVVVKAFGHPGILQARRIRGVGSKARRTWMASVHLTNAGAGTPAPVAFLERWDGSRLVESYVVTEYQRGIGSFAHELDRLYREEPDCGKLMTLLDTVARAIRKMHDSGFLHNDLGNQNILLRRLGDGRWGDVQFIDLNRGRIRQALTERDRGRDLSRIALPSDLLRVFKEMYYGGGTVPPPAFQRWESRYRKRFEWHSATRRWRHPIREARRLPAPGDPPSYPAAKDIWIWDERSAQPIVTMTSRDRPRHYPLSRHIRTAVSALKALPGAWGGYRHCLETAYGGRVPMGGRIGVAVEVLHGGQDRQLALLASLGRIPVLVRFYHHRGLEAASQAAAFTEALVRRGHPVSIALVQDRAAVLHPDSWTRFVDTVLERVGPLAELIEAGHAINRVKWGLWDFDEYRHLMEPVAAWKKRCPQLAFGGPAVIDFEYAYIPAALDALPPGFRFDALTHHLYVDRRGAPETPQGRFSALEKFALARALSARAGHRLIVTEFNWPLAGTGVYSPVGAPYDSPGPRRNDPSVSETQAAAYLLRYVLTAICSGLVERVFWWQLVARGYGLVDDTDSLQWRERPAFRALSVLLARLENSVFTGRTEEPSVAWPGADGILYRFEDPDGTPWWMAYTLGDHSRIRLPRDGACVRDVFGVQRAGGPADTADLGMLPVYIG